MDDTAHECGERPAALATPRVPPVVPPAVEAHDVDEESAAHGGNHPMLVEEDAWTCGACGGLNLGPRCLAPSCQRGPPNPAMLDGSLLADLVAWAVANGLLPSPRDLWKYVDL